MPESAACLLRERALRTLAELPPLSPILNRLIANLAQSDVSFAKVAELIEKDTVLAGNLLKLVNSALYGRRGTIISVRHAVSMLGVNKLRNAALSMSVARMWNHVKSRPAGPKQVSTYTLPGWQSFRTYWLNGFQWIMARGLSQRACFTTSAGC